MSKRRRTSDRRDEFVRERAEIAHSKSIPDLIALLDSPDLRTRFLAEMCLRDATNT